MFHRPDYPIMKHVNFTTVVSVPSQSMNVLHQVKGKLKIKETFKKIVNEITLFLGGQRYAVPPKCLF